jgi:RNA polymerase sigma factor (sigma-70 family)
MPGAELNTLLKHIQRVAGAHDAAALPDRLLVEQFLTGRSEAAFSELVRRHGPMVLGVCRSLLHQEQDAEDAFQATFLVLARKADSIRQHDAVGSWLHGVAYQVARNLLASIRRRRHHEQRTPAMSVPDPLLDITVRELHRAVAEELQRLPEKHRAALVLCYLEGKTYDQAASELSCTEGALRGRLIRGRALLQSRLERRGLGPSVGLLMGVLPGSLPHLRPGLAEATVTAALRYAAGGVAGGLVSEQAVRLADGVIKAALTTKVTLGGSLVLVLGVLVTAAFVLARPAEPPAPRPATPAPPAAVRPRFDPVALDLDPVVLWPVARYVWSVAFAPDGRTLAAVGGQGDRPSELVVWDTVTGQLRVRLREAREVRSVAFSPDRRTMATADWGENTARVRDVTTGRVLQVLRGHSDEVNCVAFSPNGQTLATAGLDGTLRLWDPATGRLEATFKGGSDAPVYAVAFRSDGKALVSCGVDPTARVWDVATGQERPILSGHKNLVEYAAFSPDGRVVATASWDHTIKLWDAAIGRELATLTGHKSAVLSLAFSPDGRLLASGGGNWWTAEAPDHFGEVKLWDVPTRQELATLHGHSDVVLSVAFTPDGQTLASAGFDKTVKLWDVARRQERATLRCPEGPAEGLRPVRAAACTPAGDLLALAGEDGTIALVDATTGEARHVLKDPAGAVGSLAFSGDGRTLASGGADGATRFWDTRTGRELRCLKGHRGRVLALAFTPDGKTLASGGDDTKVRLWDVATGSAQGLLDGHNASVRALVFAPGGKALASGGDDHTVRLWDQSSPKEVRRLSGHTGGVRAVAFSADGQRLASAAEDDTVRLWDPGTGAARGMLLPRKRLANRTPPPPPGMVALSFAPWGHVMAVGGADGSVRLWDGIDGEAHATLRGSAEAVAGLAFAADGRLFLTDVDGVVQAWPSVRARAPAPRATLTAPPGPKRPSEGENPRASDLCQYRLTWSMAMAPDGRTLATLAQVNDEATVRIWDLATGRERAAWSRPGHPCCLAYSPDGRTLALGDNDHTVTLRDTLSGEARAVLRGHGGIVRSLAFAPDGRLLLTGGADGTAKLWSVAESKEVATLAGHLAVLAVAFSPDGRTAATAGWDHTIKLWTVPGFKEKLTLRGHDKPVEQIAFSPDGKTLASASWDHTVRLWDVASGRPAGVLRGQRCPMWSLAFSPDGRLLATANSDIGEVPGDLRLWDLATRQTCALLRGHARGVRSVSFAPDGRTLASLGADGVVKLWSVDSLKP